MFLVSKLAFAFAELNVRFSVNVLLICILYCDARGPFLESPGNLFGPVKPFLVDLHLKN